MVTLAVRSVFRDFSVFEVTEIGLEFGKVDLKL